MSLDPSGAARSLTVGVLPTFGRKAVAADTGMTRVSFAHAAQVHRSDLPTPVANKSHVCRFGLVDHDHRSDLQGKS
jgi:hypothetical protein